MRLIDRWLTRWSRNYAFLRRAVGEVGRQLARRPYETFLQPGEELSFSQYVDGVPIEFGVEIYRIDPDGVMWVRVEARANLTTPLLLRPAFEFRKLPDGRAYTSAA